MNIDREIAEKVMNIPLIMVDGLWRLNCEAMNEDQKEQHQCFTRRDLPNYSTNIQHAMEVEQEMFRQGYISSFHHGLYYRRGERHRVVYSDQGGECGEAIEKTLPKAICLAALQAVK